MCSFSSNKFSYVGKREKFYLIIELSKIIVKL